MIPPTDALHRLRAGNRRFVSGDRSIHVRTGRDRRASLIEGQEPFAVIIGCSDSRVPTEAVFDQGFGDLFVIRVAGNIVAPSQIGSVEFAVEKLGTRLVVVLGHGGCGAVQATIDEIRMPTESPSANLASIVDRIRPSVERVVTHRDWKDEQELALRAVRANVQASVEQLQSGSDVLKRLSGEEELLIVGAVYSIQTGNVEFLTGNVPEGNGS